MATEVKVMEAKKQKSIEIQDLRDQENPKHDRRQDRKMDLESASSLKKLGLREWIEGIKQEIKTIHWTSPEELRNYTKIVVGATFFFGMGVYIVDLLIHSVLNFLTWISRALAG